jgi:hypothetical protein
MKTAGRENPNRWRTVPSTRVHGAEVQNRSRSITRAGKQEKLRPQDECFFLTSPFIELIRPYPVDNFRVADKDEAAGAADATREVSGKV